MAKNTWYYGWLRKWFDSRRADSRWGIISTALAGFVFLFSISQLLFSLYFAGGSAMSLAYLIWGYIVIGFAVIPLALMVYLVFFFRTHKPKDPRQHRVGNELAGIKREL